MVGVRSWVCLATRPAGFGAPVSPAGARRGVRRVVHAGSPKALLALQVGRSLGVHVPFEKDVDQLFLSGAQPLELSVFGGTVAHSAQNIEAHRCEQSDPLVNHFR